MRSLLKRAFPHKILVTIPTLGLLLALTACGSQATPPPAPPSPAGPAAQNPAPPPEPQVADPGQPPPPEQQASPAEVANQQEGCAIDDAPADTTDSAVLFVRKVQAHWQDVDARVVQAQAMQVYGRRSKDGFLQFKSEKGTVPVRISDPIPLGPEPDFSLRFAAKAQVNGQEQAAELVVMKDDKGKLHFDSIILIEPQGKVSYGWSETESAWVAGQGTRP